MANASVLQTTQTRTLQIGASAHNLTVAGMERARISCLARELNLPNRLAVERYVRATHKDKSTLENPDKILHIVSGKMLQRAVNLRGSPFRSMLPRIGTIAECEMFAGKLRSLAPVSRMDEHEIKARFSGTKVLGLKTAHIALEFR